MCFYWGGLARDLYVLSPFKSRVQPWKNARNDLTAARHGTPPLNQPIVDLRCFLGATCRRLMYIFPLISKDPRVSAHTRGRGSRGIIIPHLGGVFRLLPLIVTMRPLAKGLTQTHLNQQRLQLIGCTRFMEARCQNTSGIWHMWLLAVKIWNINKYGLIIIITWN